MTRDEFHKELKKRFEETITFIESAGLPLNEQDLLIEDLCICLEENGFPLYDDEDE